MTNKVINSHIYSARKFRRKIVSMVEKNEGMTAPEIKKATGRNMHTIYASLRILLAEGMVKFTVGHNGIGKRPIKTYFASGAIGDETASEIVLNKARELPQPFASMVAQMIA